LVLNNIWFVESVNSEEWREIPEEYQMETLKAVFEDNGPKAVIERCTEGLSAKGIPDKYQALLYSIRAHNHINSSNAENDMERELKSDRIIYEVKAGLDSVDALKLDPENKNCFPAVYVFGVPASDKD
jgi:hypothetical protein